MLTNPPVLYDFCVLNVKALVGAFNQEKALVGAFSVIVKTGCRTDGALHSTILDLNVLRRDKLAAEEAVNMLNGDAKCPVSKQELRNSHSRTGQFFSTAVC